MDIPSRCETCPIVCNTRENIEKFTQEQEGYQHFVAEHLEEAINMAAAATSLSIAPDEMNQFAVRIRKEYAERLDNLDTMVARGNSLIGRLIQNCERGPLKLRHVRGGVQYIVTLCTSTEVPDEPHEPVFVQRTPAE